MLDHRKIAELRTSNNLTSATLAEKVQTSQTNLSYIENGIKKPNVELLKRIADFFGLKVDDFFNETE